MTVEAKQMEKLYAEITEPPIKLRVCEPLMKGNEFKYVTEAVKTNWISAKGRFVHEFEEKFSKFCDTKYGISTTSGTTALHLALHTLGIGPGDEVILPSLTMIACAYAITYTGAKPVFVDSDKETWNLDPAKIEELITKHTKAIMAVHLYSHPTEMDWLNDIAEDYGLWVVEDAAEAHGALYKGKKTGSLGDLGCFSFYSNKIIMTGEGGMITTNNEELAEKARYYRDLCFLRRKRFWHKDIGFNYRMTNLQGAIGAAQMEYADELVELRRKNSYIYNKLLTELSQTHPGLVLPPEKADVKNVYWMYSILVEKEFGMSRDELRIALRRKGIETRRFFYPLHTQPIYRDRDDPRRYPVAEALSEMGVNLPSSSWLKEDDIAFVVQAIADAVRSR